MPYTDENFPTKKALREAVAKRDVPVHQPGPFGPTVRDGLCCIEGPHGYHRWYAQVTVKDQVIPKGSKVK